MNAIKPTREQAQVVSSLRRLQMRADARGARSRSRPTATSAAPRCPRTTATCSSSRSAASCACARAAGRCARATPSTRPPARACSGSTDLELPDELWARFRIPIGLAFFLRDPGRGGGLLPEPGGRHRVRARPGRVGASSCARNPVLETLEPDAEALIVDRIRRRPRRRDRPDRRGLPARRAREDELAGDLGRAGGRGGHRGLLRRAARDGRVTGAADPEPEFWVLDAEAVPHAAAPTLAFKMRVRDHSEREVYTVALTVADPARGDPARRTTTRRASACATCSASPERWGDTARSVLWAKRDVLVPSFTGSTTFELQVPCSYRPRAGHHALLRGRARRRRRRWPSTSAARSSTAAPRTGCS